MKNGTKGNIISALVGGMFTLIVLFLGPFRNMASADDIKNFVTMQDVKSIMPDNSYYIKKLDKAIEEMAKLGKDIAALKVEIKHLTDKLDEMNK
jgi:DNA integrity scanning protein DisA with diadenylate cyclase activity